MIPVFRFLAVAGLVVLLMGMAANTALANAGAKESEQTKGENADSEADAAMLPYSVTVPAARNPFPPEILDKMRKKLMVVMGVEEKTPDAEKDKPHSAPSH